MITTTNWFDVLVQYFAQMHHLGIYAGTLFAMTTVLPAIMHVSVLRPMEWVTSFSLFGFGVALDYVHLTDTATLILGGLITLALLVFAVQAIRMMILSDRADKQTLAHVDRQLAALRQAGRPIGLQDRSSHR